MRVPAGSVILRILGALCAAAGFIAWICLAWKAITDLDSVTPQSEEGGSLVTWALSGTLLLIFGMIILHFIEHAGEEEEPEERTPRR